MVELKIKDAESLIAITTALDKNGYKYSTFAVWGKPGWEIAYFTLQIDGAENG